VAGEVKNVTAPLVPPDADIGKFPWFPILRSRLFNSSFNAKASDTEWRAGVTLWIKSYDQLPSGSLPNDDTELWRLAEVKGNLRTWRRIKPMALHGWLLCDDGRLYHPLIAELINSANVSAKIQKVSCKLNENGGGNAPRARNEIKEPPLNPPQGTFLALDGGKGNPEVEVWPRWLEEMWGPLPEGPIKRQQALSASRQEPTPTPELKRACNGE
jgi:hypothetical protein